MDTLTCVGAIVPKYLPDVCVAQASSVDLVLLGDTTVSTLDDATCNGGVVQQAAGPDICVLRYGTIRIASTATVTVTGARALAMVADDDLTIDGVLDISARADKSGPAGGFAVSGGAPTFAGASGGGGAGFQTPGAPGGNTTANGGAANAGGAIVPSSLAGGPRAEGFAFGGTTTAGGGGGGAAAIISCRGQVTIGGSVAAGGGGGAQGISNKDVMNLQLTGGTGGGAGGYVVIQGRRLSLTGQFFANGGGGGGGNPGNALGSDGDRSTNPAPGGVNTTGGSGGSGGALSVSPMAGQMAGSTTTSSGGGGGGSVGFFETYTPAGVTPTVTPSTASPAFSANGIVSTK